MRGMVGFLILFAFALGVTAVLQVGINSDLRELVGNPYQTALISTTVSTLTLLLISLVVYHRPFPEGQVLRDMEWWMWAGGLIGAFFVAGTAALVSRLGGSVLFTVIILGQLVGAVILDNYGWFGVEKNPITAPRMVGIALVFLGAVIVRRG